MRMRSVRGTGRRQRAAAAVDEGPNTIRIVSLSRDENLEIIGEADQSAVEHPMRRAREREAVADNVRAARFDRPDMRGIDLGATATIDELQPADRAALVIGRLEGAFPGSRQPVRPPVSAIARAASARLPGIPPAVPGGPDGG